ncbi:hypothetical protein M899_0168 [Bacteriovorax sp. BSW11_IV]|nr:hypothetical protein M899_0168 [Bacteriovorax sp. BSW11_IV]
MTTEASTKVLCFHCNKETGYSAGAKVFRGDECPHCSSAIHCCKMCTFYDVSAYNECKEPSADRIVEKEKSNFCDYFVLKGGNEGNDKEDLLAKANALFKF